VKGVARPREALGKMGRSQPLRLVVDRRVHAEELIRFEADVVRGPGADDCAIWVAAVGADGYGSQPSGIASNVALDRCALTQFEQALGSC
jgi:hypothetical protein